MEADNGRSALTVMQTTPPDLILLDLMMPEMDGFEFVTELRLNPEWHTIPIVVVTAKDLTLDERRLLNGYVERILQKGAYDRGDLLQQVSTLVKSYIVPPEIGKNEVTMPAPGTASEGKPL
jgi:CheY-like chemotaxis protein